MTSRLSDGVLVVDKPTGPTSFDVVRRIKRAAHIKRIGHGGTLDPLASGVLPICVGEGTKLAAFLLDADKEYEFTLRFGVETDTYDAQGAVTARHDPSVVEEGHVRGALAAFTGRIDQTPPIYSALKRDGRPLYAYARAGDTVEIAPRAVTVHALDLTSFDGPDAVGLRVRCSKGTYVRSLAFDLGRRLGVGAHVTALRRTRSGPFASAAALPLDAVLAALAAGGPLPVIAPADALPHLPRCSVDAVATRLLEQGKRLPWDALEGAPPATAPEALRVRVVRPDGRLLAVAEPRADGTVKTLRVFGPMSVADPTKSTESAGIR
ncbi:MAG TPA: tRNA pseudouridine(55) synthase TruB [Polyangia bacterium]|nr:tRNA pseudouridine(55) synthase TruB [Polyangia bacterium]